MKISQCKNTKGWCYTNKHLGLCKKKPLSDPYWNPLQEEWLKDPKSEETAKKIYNCCTNNVQGKNAREYCGSYLDKKDGFDCKNTIKTYCESSIENANKDICVEFCSKDKDNCSSDRLQDLCRELQNILKMIELVVVQ